MSTQNNTHIPTPKLHIIAIAGKASSAIAKEFHDKGWEVVGSDKNIYPPVSDFLRQNNIEVRTPYHADNIDPDTSLVMVAGNVLIDNPDNPEFRKAKELDLPVLSYPELLEQYLIKENSIVVAGNFGKGTITGGIVHTFKFLGENPSYMIGGQVIGLENNIAITDSAWSVIEGDEYLAQPVSGTPPKSKFFYYHPTHLVLSSAEWDHYDFFKSEEEYIQNYSTLVKQLPPEGLLVANLDGKNIERIIQHAPCRVITYSFANPAATYQSQNLNLQTNLIGNFNLSNVTAVYALLKELGYEDLKIREAIAVYPGLVYRMQLVYNKDELIVIRDLAHSPVKAEAALQAVRDTWPNHYVVGVFDIFSSSLKNKAVLPELQGRFEAADHIIIPKVDVKPGKDQSEWVTGKDIVRAIGDKAVYVPKDEKVLKMLDEIQKPAVVVFMSSGSLRGLMETFMERIEKEKQESG